MRLLGSALKWIGGITAVSSLLIGSASVYELYSGWQERKTAVAELVQASRFQLTSHDYEGGWLLLNQALALEPASEAVRRFQIPFAMEWLRHVRVPEGKSFADVVEPLLAVLYRGVIDARATAAADVYAHIGWANYLKRRSGNQIVEIDSHFRRGLELDHGNVYANLFWGHWAINPSNRTEYGEPAMAKAHRHFDAATASGRDAAYVADVVLAALLHNPREGAVREALDFADRFRSSGVMVTVEKLVELSRLFQPIAGSDARRSESAYAELSGYLPASRLISIFDWVDARLPATSGYQRATRRYIRARLQEGAGDVDSALSSYRALAADETIDRAFVRGVLESALERTRQVGK